MKTKEFTVDLARSEIQYALKMLELDLLNEAAWVYLRGFLATSEEEQKRSMESNAKRILILEFKELKEEMHKLLNQNEMNKANRFIYLVLIDFARAEKDKDTQIKYLNLLK